MDLLFTVPLILLLCTGCCTGEEVLPDGPVDAILGKTVTLKTLLKNPTYAFIIWNFNDGTEQVNVATATMTGVKLADSYKDRVILNATNGYLTLKNLKSDDSGDYSINVISADGNTRPGEIKLRVLEPVTDVAIKSSLPEAIEHNSTVILTCTAKGSFLTFKWLRGTAPIVPDGKRITLKEEEQSSALTFTGVLRTDMVGPIYCTVANKLEMEKSAPFNLTVYYGPEDVTIGPTNTPRILKAHSNYNLTCSARSLPPATFSWYHNDKKIGVDGPVLTLAAIEKLNLGKEEEAYTCSATNAKTKRVVSSRAVSFSVMEAISGTKVSGPTATLIAGNSTANLSCEAKVGTVKSRAWQKDGKPLSAGGRVVFSADMSSIKIDPLQKEDNGEYTCVLTNPVNTDKASYKMTVNYGPEAAKVTGRDAVEMNDHVLLDCVAASVPPANFTWKFNGTLTDVKTAQYKIEMARYKNSGTYTCEAHNDVTGKTTSYTHTLSVKEEGALDEGLSDGAIAGIVIAILVALGAAIALIMYCRQKVPVDSPY